MAEATDGGKRIQAGKAMLASMGGRRPATDRMRAFAAVVKVIGQLGGKGGFEDLLAGVLRDVEAERRAEAKKELAELRAAYERGVAEELARYRVRADGWAAALAGAEQSPWSTKALDRITAAMAAMNPPRAKRAKPTSAEKKKRNRAPSPLTTQQKKALELWMEYRGNYSRVARALRVDRKTAKQHVEAAVNKFGGAEAAHLLARYMPPKFQKLPEDHRGQVALPAKKLDQYSYGYNDPEDEDEDEDDIERDEDHDDRDEDEDEDQDEDE